MNTGDFQKFAAEEGKFSVGDAVYADEDIVPVVASLDSDGETDYLIFETTPDAVESNAARRQAQSWSMGVRLDVLKQLLALADSQV